MRTFLIIVDSLATLGGSLLGAIYSCEIKAEESLGNWWRPCMLSMCREWTQGQVVGVTGFEPATPTSRT
jgi:hypothetical protein